MLKRPLQFRISIGIFVALACFATAFAKTHHAKQLNADHISNLSNATILVIRHTEKPAIGVGLSPVGEQHARAYVEYFKNFKIDGQPLHLKHLFATADTAKSHRPRLTIEPLSQALQLKIHNQFQREQVEALANEVKSKHGETLICWHHGEIPNLLRSLGANPDELLDHGKWPDGVFSWVIQLRYDENGKLIPGQTKRIDSQL